MDCIDPWLTKGRRVCPICKRKVLVAEERVRAESDTDTEDEGAPLLAASSNPQSTSGEETFVQQGTSSVSASDSGGVPFNF
jgi:E3 ubiquitin-protein ligase RNF13